MARTYFFRVSIPRYFAASVIWALVSVVCLTLSPAPNSHPLPALLAVGGFIAAAYMAIGSFINGCRLFTAWFRMNFGWRA